MRLFKNLNHSLVLWLCGSNGWERDYIFELFPFPHFVHIGINEWRHLQENRSLGLQIHGSIHKRIVPRVVVYNIENAGSDGKYTALYNVLSNNSRIVVLVHTADEFGGSPRKWKYGEGTDAYPLIPLVLRQYSVSPYRSYGKFQANVLQIPLGYMKNMFKYGDERLTSLEAANRSLTIGACKRNLSWAFVGTIKGHNGRPHMLEVFKEWLPNEVRASLNPVDMREVYQRSKFVLVGRGQSSLDCYRIYEALLCGALPVVVASDYEISRTFEFEGCTPPLVFANDYFAALTLCKNMSNEVIDQWRRELIAWYSTRIHVIMNRVDFMLNVFAEQ